MSAHPNSRPLDLPDFIETWIALQRFPKQPHRVLRSFDNTTPIAMHSVLAASVMSAESDVPSDMRWLGQQVLLRHDVIEDTTIGIPNDSSPALRTLVEGMTFSGGFKEEKVEIWTRPPIVWWLKLYDKWANCADGANPGGWMDSRGLEYRNAYVRFTHDLLEAVESKKAEIFPERPNVHLLIAGMIRGCFPVVVRP